MCEWGQEVEIINLKKKTDLHKNKTSNFKIQENFINLFSITKEARKITDPKLSLIKKQLTLPPYFNLLIIQSIIFFSF